MDGSRKRGRTRRPTGRRSRLSIVRYRAGRAVAGLLDLPADLWDGIREGSRKLRHRSARALARVADLPADAWDAVRSRLRPRRRPPRASKPPRRRSPAWSGSVLPSRPLAGGLASLRRLGDRSGNAVRSRLSAVSIRLRRLVPSWRPRVTRTAVAVGAAATVVTASAVAFIAMQEPRSHPDRSARGARSERALPGEGATLPSVPATEPSELVSYVNRRGAYRLSYPASWRLTERGARAAVADPDGAAVVTVGAIEGGSAERVVGLFVARIASVYEDVEILRWGASEEDGVPVTGLAMDAAGNQSRFVATVIDAGERDFAIGAFTPVGDRGLEEDAMAILRSFRALDQGTA